MRRTPPYDGSEPFIFFSYAHRNSDVALPIISRLTEAGYRVWYDEGIDPGTEWDENIAAHVEGCSFFLALISRAYLDSDNCKDELNYARDLNKQRVLVYLEQVELPGGMRMRLSRIQAVHKYGYQDESAFYEKLFSAQGISQCYAPPVRQEPPKPKKAPAKPAERPAVRPAPSLKPVAKPEGFFPTSLLRAPQPPATIDAKLTNEHVYRLEKLLKDAGAPAQVKQIDHGVNVTRYLLQPEPGVRASALTNLTDHIAQVLNAAAVRLEIPVPGTSMIGLEAPCGSRQTLGLRELLESEAMQTAEGGLPVALGTNLKGEPVIADLTKLPHLILGGVAGSGKSVCLHSIIASLLYRQNPGDVKLVLADPRGIEMAVYRGLPGSRVTVASDPFAIRDLLVQMVQEMINRYNSFQEKGVRNIDGYNAGLAPGEAKMPRIVFILDEFALLMQDCRKEAEEAVCRLAQLSRAAGIHLVIATQRPNAEVLTGLIRANIPSRIAFRTAAKDDSRILLDRVGAETLLGCGDMLFMPAGAFAPERVQGCFISEDEVRAVTDFLRDGSAKNTPVQQTPAAEAAGLLNKMSSLVNDQQNLLHQAIDLAVGDGCVSSSLLQRRLKLGYGRAASLVEEMERLGVIGPMDGAKPRKCLITPKELTALRRQSKLP